MMWAGLHLDRHDRGERAMNCAARRAVGELHPDLPGWTEQLAIAMAAAGNAHDLRIDQGDRIAVEDSRERPHVRRAKPLIVLAAASCLAAANLLGADRFLKTTSVSSPPPAQSPSAPASIANSSGGYHITTKPTIVRAADRAATARVPPDPKPAAPTRIAHP